MIRTIEPRIILVSACKMIKHAAAISLWNGKDPVPDANRWLLQRYDATLVFTRETGYHTSGWWKNPEYERCWHLSISFRGGKNKKVLEDIIQFLFSPNERMIWTEAPYSRQGKMMDVWHYRLFCDENWQPIKPRGEVYSRQFTERGWKSYSDVRWEEGLKNSYTDEQRENLMFNKPKPPERP